MKPWQLILSGFVALGAGLYSVGMSLGTVAGVFLLVGGGLAVSFGVADL